MKSPDGCVWCWIVAALTIVVILASVARIGLWHLDLIYLEPWYDSVDSHPDRDDLYRSFIDRQLALLGLPLIGTNILALVMLWASRRRRNGTGD